MLELGGSVNLSGDQHAAVRQQRRLAAFQHRQALPLQRPLAQGRHLLRLATGHGQTPAGPDQRVDDHRQRPGASLACQPHQPSSVVEVAVAEHHGRNAGQVDAQPVGVGDHRVRG